MSMLTELPPLSVVLDGIDTPINADFRVVLRIDELPVTDDTRGMRALKMLYGGIPRNIEAATERMVWFLRCGRPEDKRKGGGRTPRPDFSFSHDAPLLYAAYRDQYGVDLVNVPFLHWWEFRAMLDGLTQEHQLCEVRRCRSIELSKVKDKDMRRYYSEMKAKHALPLPSGLKEQQDALTEALLHGGDVSAILGCKARE